MRASFEEIQLSRDESLRLIRPQGEAFTAPWHFHPELELTWIIEGVGSRHVGDSIEAFGPGDLVLLGPRLPHVWMSHREVGVRSIALVCQFLPEIFGSMLELPEMQVVGRLLQRAERGLQITGSARDEAIARLGMMPDETGARRMLLILEVLTQFAQSDSLRPLAGDGYLPSLQTVDEERMARVTRYVLENLSTEIVPEEAARIASLSLPAFCRYFKSRAGKTFTQFVNALRVGHACRLLEDVDRAIGEVAPACGYGNLSHFNRQFRKITGMAPREYRAQRTK